MLTYLESKRAATVLAAAVLLAAAVSADELSTSFEFTDTSGSFTLGVSPHGVTFAGGAAQSPANPALVRSGTHSWTVASGAIGTITFETPAESFGLYFADPNPAPGSTLELEDQNGNVVGTMAGPTTGFVHVQSAPPRAPIARITLDNTAGSGSAAIDDFSFCAVPSGAPILDPIPEAITPGPDVGLQTIATGLTAPNWGTFVQAHARTLFVTDQDGLLWAIDLVTGAKKVFLDVSARLVPLGIFGPGSFDERGLLGVAFASDYSTSGLLYTYTSEPATAPPDFSTMPAGTTADHNAVILEWRVPNPLDPAAVVDPSSARELLRIDEPQFNHDGGAVSFGPDHMLYISLGDGGGADDQDGQGFIGGTPIIGHGLGGNGQNAGNVLGTILRIDPNGSNSTNGNYGIPAGNPFVGRSGVDEVFAYGLRNPFRFSFDRLAGTMYIADVGQNDVEEINIGVAGGNYGWNAKEGSFVFEPNGFLPGFVTVVDFGVPREAIDPVAQYDHDEGIAVVGGFVYRGSLLPSLWGSYVFGDFASPTTGLGRLFALRGERIVELQVAGLGGPGVFVLGFGQDAFGEVYLMGNTTSTPSGSTGVVMRLVPTP